MKKIMIALALIACYSAEAQTVKATDAAPAQQGSKAKSGEAYMVCKEEGGHYNCCIHHKKTVKSAAKRNSVVAKSKTAVASTNSVAKPKTAAAPAHRVAVKHKRSTPARPVAAKTTGVVAACRMVPFQVCKINADRRSVTCYPTTDEETLAPSGPSVTYGATGPMPGEKVNFKVRTIVIAGEDKGAYCRRNKENDGTVCSQPGLIVRDKNGFYSYGEPVSRKAVNAVTIK